MRTFVYVDGFNLYFGALKGTSYRWLDLRRLFMLLLPGHRIDRIKYFTAHVTPRTNDPDQPLRQQIYLRALRTLPELDIILGHYLTHAVMMPLVNPAPGQGRYVRMLKSEEKGSDVNLTTHLVHDAHRGLFDVAVLVTNDSDLLEAVKIAKWLGRQVGILNPHQNPSRVLLRAATFMKKIRGGPLSASQFPNSMNDTHGMFHKSKGW
ncbi:MAG: NYN domain-containing protein [Steroidobacteraceae bacterium]